LSRGFAAFGEDHQGLQQPDYLTVCKCLMFLDEPKGVASILDKLLKGDKNHVDHIQITADHILMLPLSDALG